MQKRIVFRHMDHSDALMAHADKQLERIVKFLDNERPPIIIDLVMERSKFHAHNRVELHVKASNYDKFTHYEGPDLYAVLDRVTDVMYRELLEEKRRHVDELKEKGKPNEPKDW